MSGAETAQVHRGLRTPIEADAGPSWRRVIHVGQPLGLGPRTVLRVCASASTPSPRAWRKARRSMTRSRRSAKTSTPCSRSWHTSLPGWARHEACKAGCWGSTEAPCRGDRAGVFRARSKRPHARSGRLADFPRAQPPCAQRHDRLPRHRRRSARVAAAPRNGARALCAVLAAAWPGSRRGVGGFHEPHQTLCDGQYAPPVPGLGARRRHSGWHADRDAGCGSQCQLRGAQPHRDRA
jgi:hypothetical protein